MRGLIVLVGVLYGLIAVGSITPLVMLLAYGPGADQIAASPLMSVWYAIPLLNASACGAIAYAFLGLRRWGRYVAISYNALWLAVNVVGQVRARMLEPGLRLTAAAAVFWLVTSGALLAVIILCLTNSAKRIMVR
jgi:hypothetical protein